MKPYHAGTGGKHKTMVKRCPCCASKYGTSPEGQRAGRKRARRDFYNTIREELRNLT